MISRCASLAVAFALLAGCAQQQQRRETAAGSPSPAHRIVALMPSMAEDLYAVGAGPSVVAVSSFTDEPQAAGLPRVADVTSVDVERIVALHADLVIGIPAQDRLVDPLRRAGIRVVLLPDDGYERIFENVHAIGELTGRQAQAQALVERLQAQTRELHAKTLAFRRHPSVFVVLGAGPIWTAGATSYIGSLVAIAGGTNAAADLPAAYGQYGAESLLRKQPDAIVTDPAIRLDAYLDREPWRSLTAVRLHRVYAIQPASMLERPGPHYTEGVRWLVNRLTPLATQP